MDFCDMSLDIRNDSNEFIGHITSADDSFEIKNIAAGNTKMVSVEVKKICFSPGTYYISLWLGNSYGTFDYIENCIRFTIKQGDQFIQRPYPFNQRAKTVLQSSWSFK
jgi:hypothetical protein